MAIFLNQCWTSLCSALAALLIGVGLAFALPVSIAVAGESFSYVTDAGSGWITSLRRAGDAGGPEFLRSGQSLGPVVLRLRTGAAPWREVRQSDDDVGLSSRFQTQGDALRWEIRVANTGRQTLEILLAFGGEVTQGGDVIGVIPRDGVRQRFHAVLGERRLHVSLARDGFAAEQPIRVSPALDRLAFTLECRSPAAHETALTITGLSAGEYATSVGTHIIPLQVEGNRLVSLRLPLEPDRASQVQITGIPSAAPHATHEVPQP